MNINKENMTAIANEIYLSWDIGIKNLAYCLIKKNTEKKFGFEILKWGIINLIGEEKKCCEKTKFNKQCTSKASYFNNTKYYCKKHKNAFVKKECEVITLTLDKKNNTSTCIYEITSKTETHKCDKKANCYIDDITKTYCTSHVKIIKSRIDKSNDLQKITKKNANKTSLDKLSLKLFEELDKHKEFLCAEEILIENQPSLTNPTMKSIMMLLYSYFIMNGLSNRKNIESKLKIIKLIAPSNKIKVSGNAVKKIETMKNEENTKQRQVYIMTKSFGVKFTLELIKDDINNTNLVNSFKKKDDMCDAFLQGFHYIFCKGNVPENVETLLNNIKEPDELVVDIDEEIDKEKDNYDANIVDNDIDNEVDNEVDNELDSKSDSDELDNKINNDLDINFNNIPNSNTKKNKTNNKTNKVLVRGKKYYYKKTNKTNNDNAIYIDI